MIRETKITLSEQEKQLMCNSEWILTKRSVIAKVVELLNAVLINFKQTVGQDKPQLPAELYLSSPKISKGENYLSLPYVILDYPRCFDKENIFAMRTMFWWANFFSCTLHLSGQYKYQFQQNIIKNISKMPLPAGLYLCVSENEWHHHFNADNYLALAGLTTNEMEVLLKKQPFIKVAFKCDLKDWDNLYQLLPGFFKELLALVF